MHADINPMAERAPHNPWRAIMAASVGNALEWFDLISYGFFAAAIAKAFFPAADPSMSLIMALGTFGVAYISRPIGGIVLGIYADRAGRKAALILSMTLMLFGTALIALTPSYATIGLIAPCLIVFARLLQGFSAGGEFANATAFLAEQSKTKRGFYASFQFASQGLATLLSAGCGMAITAFLSPVAIDDWGWRIPFCLGLIIGPVAFFIRKRVDETPEFQEQAETPGGRSGQRPHRTFANVTTAMGAIVVATIGFYMLIYMPAYGTSQLKLTAADGLAASLATGIIIMVVPPLTGYLSDRTDRVRVGIVLAAALVILPIPLFGWLTSEPSGLRLLIVQSIIAALLSGYVGPLGAFLIDLFPVRSRSTGISLSYNFVVLIFGGFAPVAMAWLIRSSGWVAAPSCYLVAGAAVSLATLIRFAAPWRDRSGRRQSNS